MLEGLRQVVNGEGAREAGDGIEDLSESARSEKMRSEEVPPRGKSALIIAGMHRSGTSALARVVNLLGYDLPKTLIGAAPSNETGHWESVLVQRFNDELLRSVSSFWFDWREVKPEWFGSAAADEFREKGREVLRQEYGGSSAIVLKDPRICRILPFWLDLLEAEGFRPVVVLPLRNPVEVAASLTKRNGFEAQAGHLMWLRHVLDAEAASRGVPRYFTDYDCLLSDWRGLVGDARGRLGIEWPQAPDAVAGEIEAFLSDKYRHHREAGASVLQNTGVSGWVREAFRIFGEWVANGESGKDYAALDRIRTELNAAKASFGWLVEGQVRQTMRVQRLENQLAESRAELESARQELEAKSAEIRRAGDDKTEFEGKRDMSTGLAAEVAEMRGPLRQAIREPGSEPAPAAARSEASRACEDLAELVRRLPEAERLAASVAERIEGLLAKVEKDADAGPDERRDEESAAEAERARIELEEQLRAARAETAKALADKKLVEESLKRRFDEIAMLTRALLDREAHMSEAGRAIRDAVAALRGRTGPSLLERLSGVRYRMWRLRQSGLFDEEWYLAKYRDVADSGMDPLFHYIRYGAEEGRYPNPHVAPSSRIGEL